MTKIYRKYLNSPHQYVKIKDKEYEIDKIIIYNNDKTILKLQWFKQNTFYLNTEIKLRRKLNFTRNENFIIKTKTYEHQNAKLYTLYINHTNIKIKQQENTVNGNNLYKNYKIIDNRGNINKHHIRIKRIDQKKLQIKHELEKTLQNFHDEVAYNTEGVLSERYTFKTFNKIIELNNELKNEIIKIEETKQKIQQGLITGEEEEITC